MKSRNMPKLVAATILLAAFSCNTTEENVPLTKPPVEITVSKMVRKVSLKNQEIPFNVIKEGDTIQDVTFYVDGAAIEGSVFTSSEVGEFKVYGEYTDASGETVKTNEEDFSVVVPGQNVVVDDFTGAWCKNCPKVNLSVHDLLEKTKNVVPIAIHIKGLGLTDYLAFDSEKATLLGDIMGVNVKAGEAPSVRINRDKSAKWDVDNFPKNTDYTPVTSIAGSPVNIGLGIYSVLDGNSLKVQVGATYGEGEYEEGDRLIVYLLEDKIIHPQKNVYNETSGHPLEGKGSTIQDFEHNEVLRLSLSKVTGDVIKSATPLKEFFKNYETTLTIGDTPGDDYSNYNKDNLVVAAMIVGADNIVKQAQKVHVKSGDGNAVYYDGTYDFK